MGQTDVIPRCCNGASSTKHDGLFSRGFSTQLTPNLTNTVLGFTCHCFYGILMEIDAHMQRRDSRWVDEACSLPRRQDMLREDGPPLEDRCRARRANRGCLVWR